MKIITARPHRLLDVCIDQIGMLSRGGERCMFLVPSQYTLQAEVEIMEKLNLTGSFLIDVLSPGRLKTRVFERAGEPDRILFDERGKCMLIRSIIEEEADSLTVYRTAARSGAEGLTKKVSAIIADLKKSDISPATFDAMIKQLEDECPAKAKLSDIARIYCAYEERMHGRLADSEDVSMIVREKLKRSGVLDGQHVFVYGFDMITPTFAADLLHMATLCASMTIAMETDKNSAADGRLFAPVNASIDRLSIMAKERGIQIEREEITKELPANPEIRTLEKHLYGLGAKPYTGEIRNIALYAASDPRMEAYRTAAAIRKMIANGTDPSDVAIVYPKGSTYGALLQNILPMYDMTVYIAEKRNAASHPLCRFILSAMAVATENWRTSDVIECIQSGFLPLDRPGSDALCAYAEGVDLRRDAWKQPFTYIKNGNPEELERLNESRKQAVEPLISFEKRLKSARSADDAISSVLFLLDEVQAIETLESMRLQLTEQGFFSEAEDCAQVNTRLMETLDQLHTLLSGEAVSAKVVLEMLASGLSAMELSALPPADGAIICGEIGNLRTAQVKTLFAIGMNDAAESAQSELLSPAEKEEASRLTGAYLGMSMAERAALSQLDTLKTLSSASERLIISYAVSDETGRALREGDAVQAVKRLFPAMTVCGGMKKDELLEMLCAPKPAMQALSVMLSDAADHSDALDEKTRQTYALLSKDETQSDSLREITRRLSLPLRAPLNAAQARTLYGRPVMSVSRLEAFAQCPYRHFVRYGLAPQEETKPGVDRAELGTLYHHAAECFTREAMALPEFPNLSEDTCDRLMDEAAAPLIEEWRQSPLGKSARGEAIAGKIRRVARRTGRNIVSQFSSSSFTPMRSELVFGQNGVSPIMMRLADGTMIYLQGRIDRVDWLESDGHIRVIDYKSGAKKFDPTMVYWGLQLQLLIYLAAALAQIPGSRAAGFFYCRIADPTIKSELRIKEEIEKQIAKKLSLAGITLSDVSILRAQGDSHAAMITKEGKINGRYAASMVDEAGMDSLIDFAKRKAASIAEDAYAGVIDDAPAERGTYVACASCAYAAVCGFDPTRKRRRRLSEKKLEDLTT